MKPILFVAALLAAVATGCTGPAARVNVAPITQAAEIPGANLPVELRPVNWTDARGSGSCVIASDVFNLHWAAMQKHAEHFRRKYAGGQTDSSIRRIHDAERIPYYYTRAADPAFLEWVTRTRRSALIWYYPSHCINFCGFHRDPSKPTDPTQYAWLLDNNRPRQFIRIPREQFLRNWAGYGGFGLALAAPPVPPPLFHALETNL